MLPKYFLSLLLFGFALQVTADTSVWKISSDKHHLFLAGTMHVLSADDYPLPPEFDQAYKQSSHLVFETDIADIHSADFQQRVLQTLLYPAGVSLSDHLSPDTMASLNEYLSSKNIPTESMLSFKPGLLLSTLTMFELQSIGITAKGVDLHFFELAKAEGKQESGLETSDEQLAFMAVMGEEDPDLFVRYLLAEIDQLGSVVQELRRAWRTGDMEWMDTKLIERMEADYPILYHQLLQDRNFRWMPQITALLTSAPVEMILVGAAHLPGDHGLLTLLEKAGYRIERL